VHNHIEHFSARVHFDGTFANLTAQSLVCAEQKLLACLTASIEGARKLRATKRSVSQSPTVLACER
jgi:hypothetical protein